MGAAFYRVLPTMNTDPDFKEASGGIISPHQITLKAGSWICRFASSRGPDGRLSDRQELHLSPWWLSSEDFRKLLFATRSSSFNYKFYARIWLAVKTDWSSMDRLIVGKVAADLCAWAGRGRTMRDTMPNGMEFIYKPPADLTQLYIPGLKAGGTSADNAFNRSKIIIDSINEVPPIGVTALD